MLDKVGLLSLKERVFVLDSSSRNIVVCHSTESPGKQHREGERGRLVV